MNKINKMTITWWNAYRNSNIKRYIDKGAAFSITGVTKTMTAAISPNATRNGYTRSHEFNGSGPVECLLKIWKIKSTWVTSKSPTIDEKSIRYYIFSHENCFIYVGFIGMWREIYRLINKIRKIITNGSITCIGTSGTAKSANCSRGTPASINFNPDTASLALNPIYKKI